MSYTPKNSKETPSNDIQKFQDFEGSWMDYVHYLHDNGALSPNLERKYFGVPRLEKQTNRIPYGD